ncbi:helix-turn-helix domain-containing protein [Woeseia oceani]|uniref:helix-turn-helix domain-containing protein n=1 Tax=Woeseia oceani TaxID=1548547 RepID=UPI0018D4AE9B|nr:helix-turn-helix transcriptional regulator [Woeseia oceani]
MSVQTIVAFTYGCAVNPRIAAKQFGLIVRQRRLKASMSQETLAAEAMCHPTYISLVERGLRNPSLDTILKLAAALNCPAWLLVQETEAQL